MENRHLRSVTHSRTLCSWAKVSTSLYMHPWPVLPTRFRTICTQPSTGLWFPNKCQHALTTSKLKWGMPPRVLDLWVSMMLKKKLHEPLTTKKAGETQWCGRPLSIKIPCSCRRLALWQTDPHATAIEQ